MTYCRKSIFIFFVLLMVVCSRADAQPDGWLDLREASLSEKEVSLEAKWELYPNHFITSSSLPNPDKRIAVFPAIWKSHEKIDFGTYRLKIILPFTARDTELALQVPNFYSSYALWQDDNLLGKNGEPGSTKESTTPAWNPDVYYFTPTSDTLELILQIANFYHVNGGTRKSIRLAEAEWTKNKMKWIEVTDYMLLITLLTIGVVCLCLSYLMSENRSPFLFLSFFVLSWALHSSCSNQYRIQSWISISWEWLIKLEHLTIFFTIITALLFVSSLFPKDFNSRVLKLLFPGLAVLFSIFALLTEPVIFTDYLVTYMAVAICLIAYVIFVIAKAFVYERAGSTIMLVSILLGAITFGYVVLSYLGLLEINMMFYNFSFMILYTMLTISMSVRIANMNFTNENDVLTFDQMYKDKRR